MAFESIISGELARQAQGSRDIQNIFAQFAGGIEQGRQQRAQEEAQIQMAEAEVGAIADAMPDRVPADFMEQFVGAKSAGEKAALALQLKTGIQLGREQEEIESKQRSRDLQSDIFERNLTQREETAQRGADFREMLNLSQTEGILAPEVKADMDQFLSDPVNKVLASEARFLTDEGLAKRGAQLRENQAAINSKLNTPTASMKEYTLAKSQGFEGDFMQFLSEKEGIEAEQLTPLERKQIQKMERDEKKAIKAAEREAINARRKINDQWRGFQRVDTDIDKAIGMADDWTTGFFGAIAEHVPGTKGHNLAKTLGSIKARVGFEEIQNMRDNSKTGGALGQVSERELSRLEAAQGALEQSQTKEQFIENLKRLKEARRQAFLNVAQAYKDDFGELPAGLPKDIADSMGDAAASLQPRTIETTEEELRSGNVQLNIGDTVVITMPDGSKKTFKKSK